MPQKIDVPPGTEFGMLTVIREAEPHDKANGSLNRYFLCRCECGTEKEYFMGNLRSDRTTACGCQNHSNRTHGMSRTKLYGVWGRTKNKFPVCNDWMEFMPFHDWAMSHGWNERLCIRRKAQSEPYSPGNCWIATMKQLCRDGTKHNRMISHNGETLCVAE